MIQRIQELMKKTHVNLVFTFQQFFKHYIRKVINII